MNMIKATGWAIGLLLMVGSPIALIMAEGAIAQNSVKTQGAEADRLALPLLKQGVQQMEAKQLNEASQSFQQVLKIYRNAQLREKQGPILMLLGVVSLQQNDFPKAIEYSEQSLVFSREFKDRKREGLTLRSLGLAYSSTRNGPKAIEYLEQSLVISREFKDREGEGLTLDLLGSAYSSMSNYPKAIEYLEQSLVFYRKFKDRKSESLTLSALGIYHLSIENYPKAIDYGEQGLTVARQSNDKEGESIALLSLGTIYHFLGSYSKAIQFQEKGLVIAREVKNRRVEASAMDGLALSYTSLKNYSKAIEYLEQELVISREIKDRQSEGSVLGNLGYVYLSKKKYTQAMEYSQQQLVIARETKFRIGQAAALANIGISYHHLGNYAGAVEYQEKSLAIAREIKNSFTERLVLNGLGLTHTKEAPELAIALYKKSIIISEGIRQDNRKLDKTLQASYTESVSETYRKLADLLLTQKQPAEAQQVLELLKIQEFREYSKTTRSGNEPQSKLLSASEQPIFTALNDKIALGNQLTQCEQTNCTERNQLMAQRDVANQQFIAAVDRNKQAIRNQSATDSAQLQNSQYTIAAQKVILANPKTKTVLVYPLILEDKLWLVWGSQAGNSGIIFDSKETPVTRKELNAKVTEFQELLNNYSSNPQELQKTSQQLYKWLIAPIRDQLDKNGVKQIVFSPDRATRYIPMAALHDGKQYLIENFAVSSILTAETDTQDKLSTRIEDNKVLGLGLTQAISGFNKLDWTSKELDSIIQTTGIYPGIKLFDRNFTETSLRQNISKHRILHIATHGKFVEGNPEDSFLVMGDGQKLGISSIKSITDLSNTHLVILSACETGKGGSDKEGIEIAGIGHYFLLGGAKSVIQSLWLVDDPATSLLMREFYRHLSLGETKTEALRKVQQDFILGKLKLKDVEAIDRAGGRRQIKGQLPADSFAHPYYWAPFILIGNSL